MSGINLKHSLAIVAVGLLAAAGSASAQTHDPGVVVYSGHAGLGASVYQHNQTDLELGVTDGTSNTIMFGERAAPPRDVLDGDIGGQFYETSLDGPAREATGVRGSAGRVAGR